MKKKLLNLALVASAFTLMSFEQAPPDDVDINQEGGRRFWGTDTKCSPTFERPNGGGCTQICQDTKYIFWIKVSESESYTMDVSC